MTPSPDKSASQTSKKLSVLTLMISGRTLAGPTSAESDRSERDRFMSPDKLTAARFVPPALRLPGELWEDSASSLSGMLSPCPI